MDSLPLEITKLILEFLDDRSRLFARLTCTEWFKIIRYDSFNFFYTKSEQLSAIVERLSKYSHPIGITFSNSQFQWSLQEKDTKEAFYALSQLTHLTCLAVPDQDIPKADEFRLTTLTNLQYLYIPSTYDSFDPDAFTNFQNITKFPLTLYVDPDWIKLLPLWTNLQHLDIELIKGENVELIEALQTNTRLASLTFKSPLATVHLGDTLTLLTRLKHLHWRSRQPIPHSLLPNLESLILQDTLSDRLDLNTNLTQLWLTSPSGTSDLTNLTKLKKLKIRYGDGILPPLRYLTALKQLEEFSIYGPIQLFSVDQICPSIKSPNFTRLTLDTVEVVFTHQISRLTALQRLFVRSGSKLGWLTSLTNLTSLTTRDAVDPNQRYITKLTKLRVLNIWNEYTGESSIDVADLINLEHLILDIIKINSNTSNIVLDKLTRLKSLRIDLPMIDIDVRSVSKMTDLTALELISANFIGFWNVASSLTTLKQLRIGDQVDESYLFCLTSLTRLNYLKMNSCSAEVRSKIYQHLTKIH